MKKEIFRRNVFNTFKISYLSIFFALVVMAMVFYGLEQTERSSRISGLHILEESILRAAIKCYAVEGSYPENILHIEKYYGVHIDRTKYATHYRVFASNILPDIMVIEL